MTKQLGTLSKVNLRDQWTSEPYDFTPWLASEAGLALLGDAIGLELELQQTEQSVGMFSADIVCRDTVTNSIVLIENQLERTDHTHLGQLLTYAAGLAAVTIVWVAARFTEEHRAALDWLNSITNESANFFGLEVELWRIGDSPYAPKLNIVSQPNDWVKIIRSQQKQPEGVTETQELYLRYWTSMRDYLLNKGSDLSPRKPPANSDMVFTIGNSHFHLIAFISAKKRRIGVSLFFKDDHAKRYFYIFSAQSEEIEREVGSELTWWELPEKKSSYVSLYLEQDPAVEAAWPSLHAWHEEMIQTFKRVFVPRIAG